MQEERLQRGLEGAEDPGVSGFVPTEEWEKQQRTLSELGHLVTLSAPEPG